MNKFLLASLICPPFIVGIFIVLYILGVAWYVFLIAYLLFALLVATIWLLIWYLSQAKSETKPQGIVFDDTKLCQDARLYLIHKEGVDLGKTFESGIRQSEEKAPYYLWYGEAKDSVKQFAYCKNLTTNTEAHRVGSFKIDANQLQNFIKAVSGTQREMITYEEVKKDDYGREIISKRTVPYFQPEKAKEPEPTQTVMK